MKIFVTGGAGYIGSVMVPVLLSEGHEVTVLDNFMYNQTSLLDCCYYPNLRIIRGDCRDEKIVKECMKGADFIFPLACLTGAPLCSKDPWNASSVIIDGLSLIIKNLNENQKIIYPTTNSGYGIGQKDIYCDENTPLNPISLYGRLKVQAEEMVLKTKQAISFRLATVFGVSPRMRLDLLVNDFVYRAVTDRFIVLFEAHFKRNYIHIRDVVNAFLHGMKKFSEMKGEVYNVGLSDCNISKKELCEEIAKQVPNFVFIESPIGEDLDKRNYIVSNEKIERTGFKPKWSLKDGITELIKGFQIIRKNQYSNV